jgi:lipoprotein-anchoring transpeptidase ErfK/SrfK
LNPFEIGFSGLGNTFLSRRKFLQLGAIGLANLPFRPLTPILLIGKFPQEDRLGRVNVGMAEVKKKPDADSPTIGKVYEDEVFPWMHEVVGKRPYRVNQRWIEIPQGYVWAAYLQPVKNMLNQPVLNLPDTGLGAGMWAEVTVPFVDLVLINPPARSPLIKTTTFPRLYYRQVLWIDQVKTDSQGQIWYRVNERYGYGDLFWAAAEGFRPLTNQEIEPIHPDADNKRIVVDVSRQIMACFEGKAEVYYTRVSTGILNDITGKTVDNWATPLGTRPIWRKLISVHMSGGTTGGGYDLLGVSWTSLFIGSGVAIHSTFWHNNFGEPMSHGCVNATPEDAKWVFRWTNPTVSVDPGDITVGMPGGTLVEVIQT